MTSVEGVPVYLLPGVPVAQPPNLEGDPSLATEILPGPPPLVSIQQTGLPRRDHKKAVTVLSYLPVSDPGTTYTGHMAAPLTTTTEVDGSRRKRARLDKGSASSRAQRASARSMNGAVSASDPIQEAMASSSHLILDSDPISLPLDSDEAMLSRSNSLLNADDSTPPRNSLRRSQAPRRDKGKGREKDVGVKVKEEPFAVTLAMSEVVPSNRLLNQDHCSSCRSLGSLVYCDGCPKAFHLWCLDPPMEASDLPEGDARWYCPGCVAQQKPPIKLPASLKFITPLIEHLESSIPTEFQLPQDVRSHFKDVGASPRGTYVDTSEVRQLRLNRHGQLEDRDPYRLKDRNGDPVLCFRCGTSALSPGVAAAAPAAKRARRETSNAKPSDSGRSIVSCDYCHLSWHLDCVDPPLACMPPWGKKWMCPNHADQNHQPKRRVPRANATPIEITKPRQPNNGNIEVVQPETVAALPNKIAVDEVLINGRRYRVPERIIMLDFWNKVGNKSALPQQNLDDISGMSSPLTSLSSLGEDDDILPSTLSPVMYTTEDVEVAQLLTGMLSHQKPPTVHSDNVHTNGTAAQRIDIGTQTSVEVPPQSDARPANGSMKTRSKRVLPVRTSHHSGARTRSSHDDNSNHAQSSIEPVRTTEEDTHIDSELAPATAVRTRRVAGRRAAPRKDRSGGAETSTESLTTITSSSFEQPKSTLKQEPVVPDLSSSSISARPKRTRQPPRKRLSPAPITNGGTTAQNDAEVGLDASGVAEPPHSETLSAHHNSRKALPPSKLPDSRPIPSSIKAAPTSAIASAGPSAVKAADATPTLKIRLPRLASINLPSLSSPSTSAINEGAGSTSPSQSSTRKPARSRSRRANRRQASTSTSLNRTSVSSEMGSTLRVQ